MQPHTLLTNTATDKSAMHAVISSLLKIVKCWWYLLLTSSMMLHDVIMASYCCQPLRRVSGNDFVFQQHRRSQSVSDITRFSCFVTTMKLLHTLQIYSTVFLW